MQSCYRVLLGLFLIMTLQTALLSVNVVRAVVPYDISNLNFFDPISTFHYCIWSQMKSIDLVTLEYLAAFFLLALILLLYSMIWLYNSGFYPIVCMCRPMHVSLFGSAVEQMELTEIHGRCFCSILASFFHKVYNCFVQASTSHQPL